MSLRVISGRFRGRRLASPAGRATRPASGRTRQGVMNILGPERVRGASVLDLFAGTGAVGIEALSRGARSTTFVEKARPALTALRANLETLGLGPEEAAVVRADVAAALRGARPLPGEPFDLVFCDPPYAVYDGGAQERRLAAGLAALAKRGAVVPDAVLVVEHPAGRGFGVDPGGWRRTDERRWSRAGASLYALRAGFEGDAGPTGRIGRSTKGDGAR